MSACLAACQTYGPHLSDRSINLHSSSFIYFVDNKRVGCFLVCHATYQPCRNFRTAVYFSRRPPGGQTHTMLPSEKKKYIYTPRYTFIYKCNSISSRRQANVVCWRAYYYRLRLSLDRNWRRCQPFCISAGAGILKGPGQLATPTHTIVIVT